MSYTGEFREKAQNELAKRLGYNSLVECVQDIGSKTFAKQRNDFYPIYQKEVYESELDGHYTVGLKRLKNGTEDNFALALDFIETNPETTLRETSEKFNAPYHYLSVASKLGFIKNIRSGRFPEYKVDYKNKRPQDILMIIRKHGMIKQREVRVKDAKRVENGY